VAERFAHHSRLGWGQEMIVATMQPTYLPWLGYFNMMAQADVFVLLDNVQFAKRSWQQRNRIKTQQGELMLTVPVLSAHKFHQRMSETLIDTDSRFGTKHAKTIERSYSKAPYARHHMSEVLDLVSSGEGNLAQFNEAIISWLALTLEIDTRIIRGSDLQATGDKTQLTVNQLTEIGADTYFAAAGSRPYVSTEPAFSESGIKVIFQDFQHPVYEQLHGPFISHLASIDALFNLGADQTRNLIDGRSIRR